MMRKQPDPSAWQVVFAWASVSLLLGFLAFVIWVGHEDHHEPAPKVSCQSHLRQLGTVVTMYVQDYDGRLPLRESWTDAAFPYSKTESILSCPSAPSLKYGYAYNLALDRKLEKQVRRPEEMPLFFDSTLGRRNAADLLESFAPRHTGTGVVAFLDGHVKAVKTPPSPKEAFGGRRSAVQSPRPETQPE
jgi:prepilin-type processing-associated H-X9-DG protein